MEAQYRKKQPQFITNPKGERKPMFARKFICILLLSLIFFSCSNDSFEDLFEKLTSNTEIKEISFSCNLDSDMDVFYKKIVRQGEKNNSKLMELSLSEVPTNWITPLNSCKLTKGDLAISILLDVNEIDDSKFELLIPDSIKEDYQKNGVRAWWDWIHSDIENRKYVVNQLKHIIGL